MRLERGKKLDLCFFDSEYWGSANNSTIWNTCKKSSNQNKWKFLRETMIFPCWKGEILHKGQPFSTAINKARRSDLRRESQQYSSEEKEEARDPDPDVEVRQDFWSILGNYICRNHVALRTKLYVPKDDLRFQWIALMSRDKRNRALTYR